MRNSALAICGAFIVCGSWTTEALAAPPGPPATDPAAPEPTAPQAAPASPEAAPTAQDAPQAAPSAPEAAPTPSADPPPTSEPTSPDAPVSAPEGTTPEATPATAPTAAEPPAALDPDLLSAPAEAAPASPPPTTGTQTPSTEADLSRTFRPADNPARLNLGARASLANVGGREEVGGRMGGVQVDVGQAWNNFGYAVTLSAWGGRVDLPADSGAQMNGLFGIGPSFSLGRRALVGRGYLDLQLGYDFYYGLVSRRRGETLLAPQGNQTPNLAIPGNIVPHGPRINLDIGLLAGRQTGPYFHGVGVSVGYQPLVHTFNADMPVVHMLTIGFSYWMG